MEIIIFTHCSFMDSYSMPKYALMLGEGMKSMGHKVDYWTAQPLFYKIPGPKFLKKWLGYIDQFLVFPLNIKFRIKKLPESTLFVLADHALGPWLPYLAKRPVVVHCHDFIAQRSALNQFPENKLKISGKLYQNMIRNGYRKGENFISISRSTKKDLHSFLKNEPRISTVIYNGLNQQFEPGCAAKSRKKLSAELNTDLNKGYILHIGGDQFYKNRKAVLKIYLEWYKNTKMNIPLLMVGPKTDELNLILENSYFQNKIEFIEEATNTQIRELYKGALVLLYPSIIEGFGWPIAEAMASGCPVLTINKAPMNEVAGTSSNYLPCPSDYKCESDWTMASAHQLNKIITLKESDRQKLIDIGIENGKRFNTQNSIQKIEVVYKKVLQNHLRSLAN